MRIRTQVIGFRATPAEVEVFKAAADREGFALSVWFRWVAMRAAEQKKSDVPPPEKPLSLGGAPIEFDDVPREPQQ